MPFLSRKKKPFNPICTARPLARRVPIERQLGLEPQPRLVTSFPFTMGNAVVRQYLRRKSSFLLAKANHAADAKPVF